MGFDRIKQFALFFMHLVLAIIMTEVSFRLSIAHPYVFGVLMAAMSLNGYGLVLRFKNWKAYGFSI